MIDFEALKRSQQVEGRVACDRMEMSGFQIMQGILGRVKKTASNLN